MTLMQKPRSFWVELFDKHGDLLGSRTWQNITPIAARVRAKDLVMNDECTHKVKVWMSAAKANPDPGYLCAAYCKESFALLGRVALQQVIECQTKVQEDRIRIVLESCDREVWHIEWWSKALVYKPPAKRKTRVFDWASFEQELKGV